MAKTAAAIGVPKTAANAALIPHITITWWSNSSKWKILPSWLPMLPPNWIAAPSRPAEPPVKWVSTVDTKISGADFKGTSSLDLMVERTWLVPPSFLSNLWYIKTIIKPATGSNKNIHLLSALNAVTHLIHMAKTLLAPPTTTPVKIARAIHLKKFVKSLLILPK